MAKSGIIYGARGGNAYGPRLELHWSVVSQDIAKNTTKIKVISIFNVNAAISYSSSKGKQGSTTVGGTTQTYTAPAPSSASQRTRTLGTTYHTITHTSNGTYTGTLSGTFNLGSLAWAGTTLTKISASGSITLDTIVRGIDESSVTLASGWSNTTNTKTITFTKYNSSATVKVFIKFWDSIAGSWSSLRTLSTNYSSGGSITFANSLITEMHNKRPNNETVQVRVYVEHYQGTAVIGTVSKDAKLALKVEAPDISLTVSCTGRNITNLKSDKRGVQNVHYMNASVTGTAKNGATIKRYQITFQGRAYSSSTLKSLITQTGTLKVQAQVWDSRGFTRITSTTIYSYAYTPPKLSGLVARRYTGTTIDPIGTSYKVTANISYTQMTADGEQACWPRWKFGSESYTYSTSILKSGTLAIEKSLQFTLYYADSYSDDRKYIVTIPTGQATFVLGKQSVGIGMIPPANSRGLYVKDGFINEATFGGVIRTNDPLVLADSLPAQTVKLFMTEGALPLPFSLDDFGWGFAVKRWDMTFVELHTLRQGIYVNTKANSTADWAGWKQLSGKPRINSLKIIENTEFPGVIKSQKVVEVHGIAYLYYTVDLSKLNSSSNYTKIGSVSGLLLPPTNVSGAAHSDHSSYNVGLLETYITAGGGIYVAKRAGATLNITDETTVSFSASYPMGIAY